VTPPSLSRRRAVADREAAFCFSSLSRLDETSRMDSSGLLSSLSLDGGECGGPCRARFGRPAGLSVCMPAMFAAKKPIIPHFHEITNFIQVF
jgi:hypothetical protein